MAIINVSTSNYFIKYHNCGDFAFIRLYCRMLSLWIIKPNHIKPNTCQKLVRETRLNIIVSRYCHLTTNSKHFEK